VAEDPRNSKPLRFDGRVVVVTGAGRRLGREFVRLLARRGATVVGNDICRSEDDQYGARDAEDDDAAQRVVEEIESAGGSAIAITADASDPASGERIMTPAVRTFGGSDILINNAGIVPYAPLEELSSAQFLRTIAVDAGGAFHLSREAWRHFHVAGYGRVVRSVLAPVLSMAMTITPPTRQPRARSSALPVSPPARAGPTEFL